MISYRGIEAVDCFGMQPAVEPDLGLCVYLKPNRFRGTERKCFIRALHVQGSFIFTKDDYDMDFLQQSASAWKELTEYRYIFTYGYRQKLYPVSLTFSPKDYPHLAGFQYMKDISLPNYSSTKVVDRIMDGKILNGAIQKAALYTEMIEPRLKALIHLKNSLGNDFTLYSYMPHMYPFPTSIKADYLISSHIGIDSFIFVIQADAQENSEHDFLCCSAFQQGTRNYEANQRSRILMKKERIHLPSNTSTLLLDKLAFQKL